MSPRKPGKSFPLSRAHKEKALEHIRYEIEKVCECGCQTPWQGLCGPPDSYKTPLFESFMLHVQSLLGFFETEAIDRRSRDILACDYGFKARKVCKQIDKRDLDRYLSHLTYWSLERHPLRQTKPPPVCDGPRLEDSQ